MLNKLQYDYEYSLMPFFSKCSFSFLGEVIKQYISFIGIRDSTTAASVYALHGFARLALIYSIQQT